MNWFKETLQRYIGEILTILGAGIFSYNIFNFSSTGGRGGEWVAGALSRGPDIGRYEFEYVAYYYPNDTLLLIALGAILIVAGLLVVKNRGAQ